jgi:hypothetical protein
MQEATAFTIMSIALAHMLACAGVTGDGDCGDRRGVHDVHVVQAAVELVSVRGQSTHVVGC